jgi:hypothetical protein
VYQVTLDGRHYELGTSGFLYRSNKLMYDHETQSLWSTMLGEPVVGPLAGKGINLPRLQVVTTTWGQWRKRHPGTSVLALQTGYSRDYTEGAAYRSYFATDRLMFSVPRLDRRLKNKNEVVALRDGDKQLAIATDFLRKHPVYEDQIGSTRIVILTDESGANRVYRAGETTIVSWDGAQQATDSEGLAWTVSEAAIASGEKRLIRFPAHRAFWFGWYSQFPATRLIK